MFVLVIDMCCPAAILHSARKGPFSPSKLNKNTLGMGVMIEVMRALGTEVH